MTIEPAQAAHDEARGEGRNWFRLLLLPALVGMGIGAAYAFHFDRYLSFQALAAHRAWLIQEVAQHRGTTILVFAGVYVVATALSLPGATILTLAAGFLFGTMLGTAVSVVSATVGASVLFLIARTSLGEVFRTKSEGALAKLRDGFARGAFNYLLFLRLVPAFPFWLVNLVAAFLKVPLRTFVLATAIGIIPGGAVYASVGNGLGAILDRGQKPDFGIIFSPPILIPLLALAALSLVPILYRGIRRSS